MEKKSFTSGHRPPNSLFWGVLIASVAVGWFYWYQWRPSKIRGECSKVSNDYYFGVLQKNNSLSTLGLKANDLRKDLYQACLNTRGITK